MTSFQINSGWDQEEEGKWWKEGAPGQSPGEIWNFSFSAVTGAETRLEWFIRIILRWMRMELCSDNFFQVFWRWKEWLWSPYISAGEIYTWLWIAGPVLLSRSSWRPLAFMNQSSGVYQGAVCKKETDRVFTGARELSILPKPLLYRAARSSRVDGQSWIRILSIKEMRVSILMSLTRWLGYGETECDTEWQEEVIS